MGKGEGQVLGQELLDVRALDIIGLLDLNNTENLKLLLAFPETFMVVICTFGGGFDRVKRTWMDLKRARWRAAMSW